MSSDKDKKLVSEETINLLESMVDSIDYYRGTYLVCFVLSIVAIITTKVIED